VDLIYSFKVSSRSSVYLAGYTLTELSSNEFPMDQQRWNMGTSINAKRKLKKSQ
jgi:hypothetical protein